MRRSSGLAGSWARAVTPAVVLFALLGTFVLNGGASTAAAATAQSASSQTAAIHLVQEYLAALGPAGSKFLKVEAELKALGPSATRAQVLATVAPLGPVLAPIEALLAAPPPTTLEAVGQPTSYIGGTLYRTTGQGAHLDVGGRLYLSGFQVGLGVGSASLTWPTHDRYTSLSGQFGVDELGRKDGGVVTVSFDDGTNTSIPFTDRGKLVFSAALPTTGFVTLSVPLAHESKVTILFYLDRAHNLGSSVVDVVNDRLS